jgi:hypothetical protein
MMNKLNSFLDIVSEFACRKGLLLIGILLISSIPLQVLHLGWISDINLFLHLNYRRD